ncbi:MAG TPA: tetratricopeptide repeat protein [Phycisphaerae bacterium]|nr:tetratricopeptide repeat protein [Phycisphaerae bacterium]
MARKLNKRLLGMVALFVGVPVVVVLFLVFSGMLSTGDPKVYFEDAKTFYENEEYAQAWIAIRNAVKTRGGNRDPDITFLMSQIAMKQKPPSVGQALQALRTTVALKPDHVEAQRRLAELYLAVRYWKEAKAEINRLIELDPTFGKAYLWGGVVEMGLADAEALQAKKVPYYEAAAEFCRAGLDRAPDLFELYRLLAQIHTRLNQEAEVDKVIDLALANNPISADAYILKASRLLGNKQTDEAMKILKLGIEKAGQSARLYVALGEVAVRENDSDAAKEYFTGAVAADPTDETGYLRLASIYRLERDNEKAIGTLEQGLAELPESMTLLAQEADLYLEMGQNEKADELIARLEKGDTRPGVVAYLKGKRAMIGRQIRQAITYLEQARDLQMGPQSRLLLGRAYLMADELGAAQRELENLVADNPRLTPAWRTLAQVQLRLRNFDKASRSAKVVLDANPADTDMRLLIAQTLLLQNRPQDALAEARKAAERVKEDPDPYLLMAEIHQQMDQNAVAEAMYRRAVALDKDLSRVYQRFLRFYRDTKQQDKFNTLLEEVKKALPRDEFFSVSGTPAEIEKELGQRVTDGTATPGDLLALARLFQMTDRDDEAKEYYAKAMAKTEAASPEWRQAWQQLFLVHLAKDEYGEAAKLVEQLKKVDSEAPELLFADPLLLLGQDKLDEAVAMLRAVIEKHKTLSQGHFLLGQVLARQRKFDEAMAAVGKALEGRPNLVPARLLLGRIYHSQGNYSGALTEANEALRFSPRLVPALEMKAGAQAGLGSWAAALKTREEIAEVVPDKVNNLIALATLHLQEHDPVKAEATFTRAYQLAPDNSLLVRAFADFYADTNRVPQGAKIIDAYVEKHKDSGDAYIVRAQFVAKVSGPDEAEKDFRKAAELAPESPYPMVYLGDQHSRLGQWSKAAQAYAEAVKRAGKDNVPRKRLADVYMLDGKLDEAKAAIDAVLESNPNDVAALVVAGRIAARQDREAEAEKYIEQALALRPDYGEAKVRLAEMHAGPDPMRALDLLSGVDPSDSSFEKAMLLRADINTRRVLLTEAILDLRRLLDFRPTSMAGRMQLAAKYIAIKEPGRAAELLAQLSKERLDKDPMLLVALGDAYMRAEKYADSLAAYEKARAAQPDAADALTGEVRCLVALDRKKEALDRVHHVMNTYPNEVWPRMALVALYEKTNELDKGFEALRTGLLRRQDWESGYVYLADLLVRANRVEEARQILLTGLSKMPKSIPIRAGLAALDIGAQGSDSAAKILKPLAEEFEAQYSRMPDKLSKLRPYMTSIRIYSLALYNLGKTEEALKWGMMLWSLDPTDVANANNMAWILATEHKDFTRARDMIQRCMRLVPNHPQVLDTAGWIAFLNERLDEATENLLASIRYGDNPEARYHLGRVYEARQRPDEARAEYQKAIELGLKARDRADAEKRLKGLASASP